MVERIKAITKTPHLETEFVRNITHPERNIRELSRGSDDRCEWKCSSCGYLWDAVISRRQNTGCPACAGKAVIIGVNDFLTRSPHLKDEWDFERNGPIQYVTCGSSKKFWWKCLKGHQSYHSAVSSRVSDFGCRLCGYEKTGSHRMKTDFKDSLQNLYLEISIEFVENITHPSRSPSDFPSQSNDICVWRCRKGHEWETAVSKRVNGRGCPKCVMYKESKFEYHVAALVRYMIGLDVVVNNKVRTEFGGVDIDLYIPELDTYVDLDPYYWHKDKSIADTKKNFKCQNLKFFRVRDKDLPTIKESILVGGQKNSLSFALGVCEAIRLEPVRIPTKIEFRGIIHDTNLTLQLDPRPEIC